MILPARLIRWISSLLSRVEVDWKYMSSVAGEIIERITHISTAIHRAMGMPEVIILISSDLMRVRNGISGYRVVLDLSLSQRSLSSQNSTPKRCMPDCMIDRDSERIINYCMQVTKRKHMLLSPGRW